MGERECDGVKPHAIMVEFLFQGHINPFINLAIGLASKGCTVTYVRTEFIHHRISSNAGQPDSLFAEARRSGLDIRVATISDGFPLDFDRHLNIVEFYESILLDFPGRVDGLVGEILESGAGGELKAFIVADASYLWLPAVAAKHNIASVSFWASPALRLSVGYHLELLKEKAGLSSYDDLGDDIPQVPGVKLSNVRDFIRYAPREEDTWIPAILRESIFKAHLEVRAADFIFCNTVQELEYEALSASNMKLPVYPIGPTNFLGNNAVSTNRSLRSETDCTQWLCSKPPGSVVFISFGSVVKTDKAVIVEIARGLRASRANFLWVLRPDVAAGGETGILPPGFEDDIGGRGLIIPWCNQCDVLANPAVGAFLTHCGWSSVLESIWFGVPMVCYPNSMDQPTNRNMIVHDWKIGINLCDKPPISAEEVAKKVDSLMSGTRTELETLKMEMKKINKIVHDALAQNGSSDRYLDKFLNDFKDKMRNPRL